MKIILKKSLALINGRTTVSFTEAQLILKLIYQCLSRGTPVQICLCELIFPIFLLQIDILKLWAERLIGNKIIFTLRTAY